MSEKQDIAGEELREHVARQVARADFSGFADKVMKRIADERPVPLAERVRVWLREALRFHPVRIALAAAATVALFVGTPAMLMGRGPASNVSVVHALEFGAGGGTVYTAPDEMTVIWIGEGG